ncbi:uncharacterized protein FRV6_10610 [Fusarium oxysporum]|uniref:Uncharacterized protein n=1 Tax=Fusarium oxysporum TaxID=5507 RepID=A0A2H3TCP2_FUSOX|nr:uncharacterized protein FRV6_10610 [Fusarium oxysporum]
MASQTSPKRRLNNTSTLPPSVEVPSDDVCPLSNGNNLNDDVHPADNQQSEERDTYSALVLGREMLVPLAYDPDTYDFDARMPWTPEPEPYDPETYSAWGRKHFGEEWYQLRKSMLEERNPHHKLKGGLLDHTLTLWGTISDEGWKRLWARMSNNELGFPRSPSPPPPPSDSDSDSSESREPTPVPADPWERIEYMRTHWHLTEEKYHFHRFFVREEIIDRARSRRENEPGNRQAREKRDLMESFRYVNPSRFYIEQNNIQDHIDLPKKGWTREEIVAVYEAQVGMLEWPRNNSAPRGPGDFGKDVTPEEEAASASYSQEHRDAWNRFYGSQPPKLPPNTRDYGRRREALLSDATGDAASCAEELQRIEGEEQGDREALERAIRRFRVWDELGVGLKVQNDLAREYGFAERVAGHELPQPPATAPQVGGIGDAPGTHMREAVAQSSATTPQPARGTLRKTCGGRITKNTLTHAEASPRTASQRHNRQRKTYKKERASRRLAKLEPEYGMLEDARRR